MYPIIKNIYIKLQIIIVVLEMYVIISIYFYGAVGREPMVPGGGGGGYNRRKIFSSLPQSHAYRMLLTQHLTAASPQVPLTSPTAGYW